MSKLNNLFDLEFKRNRRNYFIVILTFCVLLFTKLLTNLTSYNYIVGKILKRANPNILGRLSFDNLITDGEVTLFIIGIAICFLYSIVIWARDFIGKNKSIYTLYMLPQNKTNIYLSKLLNILCFVYMYVMSFVATLFMSYIIITPMMEGDTKNFGFVQATVDKFFDILPYNFNSFVYNYVVISINIISLLFMIVLFWKYVNVSKLKHVLLCFLMFIYFVFVIYKIYIPYVFFINLNLFICLVMTILNIIIGIKFLKKMDL